MVIDPLARRLAGDLDGSFEELVLRVQDGLYAGSFRFLGDAQAAEEVAQDALVRAHRALARMEPAAILKLRLRPWIWTIALNLCRNRARSARRRPPPGPLMGEVAAPRGGDPQAALLSADLRRRLADELARLSLPARTAVVLRHVVGMGYREMSEVTGEPEGTLKARVHRGLAELRTACEGVFEEMAS